MSLAAEQFNHRDYLPSTGLVAENGETVSWLKQRRAEAADCFLQQPLPDRKQEAWRYTPLEKLTAEKFQMVSLHELSWKSIKKRFLPNKDSHYVVFINGNYSEKLSSNQVFKNGVVVDSLKKHVDSKPDLLKKYLNTPPRQEFFNLLNFASWQDGMFLFVPEGIRVLKPIELIHLCTSDEYPIAQPKHLVIVGKKSRVSLVESHYDLGDERYFTNQSMDIFLDSGAKLTHECWQQQNRQAFQFSSRKIFPKDNSHYQATFVSTGCQWSRNDVTINFEHPGASCDIASLCLAGDEQVSDLHLDIQHKVGSCSSNENVKAILDGDGHHIFDGAVKVLPNAQKTNATLLNHNLVLSSKAEIDSKPQLEIFADDVQCNHGTSIGQPNEEMLFYLRSRGISEQQSRQMLCLGFAEDILQRISSTDMQTGARQLLQQRLNVATYK